MLALLAVVGTPVPVEASVAPKVPVLACTEAF